MRVTNRMLTLGFLRNLGITTTRLQELQDQLATGKRIRRPSDDPTSLPKVLFLRDALKQLEVYQANISDSKNLLALAEKAISSAVEVVQEIRQDAVAGANGTLAQDSLNALADKTDALLNQLITIANRSYEGRYLFGGFRTLTPPFVRTGSVVTYQGDLGTLTREIDRGAVIDVSIPGSLVFSNLFDTVLGLIDDLRAGNIQNISSTRIQQIDQALENLLSYQAQLGARWARTENTEQRLMDFRVHLQDLLSQSEDVDIAEVIVNIQAEENVYRAALAAGARLIQPTLLDFLR